MTLPDTYRPLLLSGGLHASADRTPRKPALVCEGVARTYAELAGRVRRVCGGAQALGLQPGDRAAILAPNCIEYPELVCGLSDAGGIVATVNARSTTRELEDLLNDCGARLLVVHPSLAAVAAAASVPTLERTIVLGEEYESWLRAATPSPPRESIAETDPFTLVYSSGTTGTAEGHRDLAPLAHAHLPRHGNGIWLLRS